MRKLIFILLLAALVVMPGMAITVEYFSNPPEEAHQGWVRPTDTYASNAELLTDVKALAGGSEAWDAMNDTEQLWIMTKFTRQHGLKSKYAGETGAHDVTPATTYVKFTAMANDEYGFMCLGHALLLTDLCNLTGIEAYSVSAGNVGGSWTHAFTIAKCTIDGHEKFVLADPYFGDMYCYANETPMSFFAMQDFITAEEYSSIYHKAIGYKYDMFTVTNATYDYNAGAGGSAFTGNIYNTLVSTDVGDDRRIWRCNNWFITPYCQATEATWSAFYDNPYELFNDVYSCLNTDLVEVDIADVEAEET